MRFSLSTLMLCILSAALAFGWFVDRYTNRVPGYEQRLADHARLAATLVDVHRLHSISDFPEAYLKRTPDMLFSVYLDLYKNKELFERTYGPIGNAKQIDAATLRKIGGETLRRIEILTADEFRARLTKTGLGKGKSLNLYDTNGSLKPEVIKFVEESLAAIQEKGP